MNGLSAAVLRKYPVDVRILENSSHFYYTPGDQEILLEAFCEMIG